MNYIQLTEDGEFLRKVDFGVNAEWDATHFCPPDKLTAEEAAYFRVVPLADPVKPQFNSTTEALTHDGYVEVDGAWQYHFVVSPLPPETVAENLSRAEQSRVDSLWRAAHDKEFNAISGSAVGLITIGILSSKPKCIAVQAWINSLWSIYYERKANGSANTDYSECGEMPHAVPELMAEVLG